MNGVRATTGASELSSVNFHGENKPGVRLSAAHDVSDRWQLGGELGGFRSRRRRARYATASAPPRRRLAALVSKRTPGVPRQRGRQPVYRSQPPPEYTLSGKERLWQTPWLTLDLQPGLSASASRTDTAYTVRHGPRRHAALAVDHTLYQRYDTVWSQQLLAGGGGYWQNHAAGAITVLGYGQRRWNNVVDTGLMLNWDKRPTTANVKTTSPSLLMQIYGFKDDHAEHDPAQRPDASHLAVPYLQRAC